jgi:hypothetical protein
MPLTRFKLSAIEDGGIATADLADGAVTTAKIDDGAVTLAKTDSLFLNTEISGTEAARMPNGTTAQRANAQSGDIRFNSTTSLMEYYDGVQWKSIDSPPSITSADVSDFDTAGDTITLTGNNFQSGMTVKLVGADATEYNASSVTVTDATTASFDITAAMATDNDPFDIVVTNLSGLSSTLSDALDFAPTPAFTVASGSLSTIYDSARTGISITTGATSSDADDTITYSISSGSLPSGLSLNSSTGAITGDADAVGSNTTSSFTLQATATSAEDGGTATNTRNYSITVNGPTVQSFTSVGSGSFSVPTGISSVDLLMVAGGGGGGGGNGTSGGGGAGGLIFISSYAVTPGGSIPYNIGAGGSGGPVGNVKGTPGQNTTFDGLTTIGGGGGGAWANPTGGIPGGSGGGGGNSGLGGGTGTQPQQPGQSGSYGFGNPGGTSSPWNSPYAGAIGGGGGGAGGQGKPGPGSDGQGGEGKSYDISGSSVFYAGGGGGGTENQLQPSAAAWGNGGSGVGGYAGGGINHPQGTGNNAGSSGVANRGSGGGAGSYEPGAPTAGGSGAAGIIVVKY